MQLLEKKKGQKIEASVSRNGFTLEEVAWGMLTTLEEDLRGRVLNCCSVLAQGEGNEC